MPIPWLSAVLAKLLSINQRRCATNAGLTVPLQSPNRQAA